MKQLTDEIRLQIFQQNIGQKVNVLSQNKNGDITAFYRTGSGNRFEVYFKGFGWGNYPIEDLTLLKRPLSSITDEEAIEMFKYMGLLGEVLGRDNDCVHFLVDDETSVRLWFDGEILSNENIQGNGWPIYLSAYQYLNSRGFALPYLDWSVEELVKENVYKLEI